MSSLKCPMEGCENEVDIILEEGKLYWIDKSNFSHKGLVESLPSPKKEEFLGYAYEKGLISPNNRSSIEYTTAGMNVPVNVKENLPYESAFLFIMSIFFFTLSFITNIFSQPLLYILGAYFLILSVAEYFF